MKEVPTMGEVINGILAGKTVLFIDGFPSVLLIGAQGFETRNIPEPETEANVRGSREGFNEVLKVNSSLIRRKINNSKLIFEDMKIGEQTLSLTAITGFIVTALNDAIILSRFFLLFLAGGFGFYGLLMGTFILVVHICSLRSFGTPYLTSLARCVGGYFLYEFQRSFPLTNEKQKKACREKH